MYDYGMQTTLPKTVEMGLGSIIWIAIVFVIALIGCFLVYFLFINKEFKTKNKFLVWLKGFLKFDKMLIEIIYKLGYYFVTIFITLGSFALIGTSFLGFLFTLVFGNIINRVLFEAFLIKIQIWKNTTEINKKMK